MSSRLKTFGSIQNIDLPRLRGKDVIFCYKIVFIIAALVVKIQLLHSHLGRPFLAAAHTKRLLRRLGKL